MRTVIAIGLATLLLAGCAAQGGPEAATGDDAAGQTSQAAYSEECGRLLADAAAVEGTDDTVEDTDAAIFACASVAEFSAAAEDHPEAIDGADPVTWLENRCRHAEGPDVKSSAICQELAG